MKTGIITQQVTFFRGNSRELYNELLIDLESLPRIFPESIVDAILQERAILSDKIIDQQDRDGVNYDVTTTDIVYNKQTNHITSRYYTTAIEDDVSVTRVFESTPIIIIQL